MTKVLSLRVADDLAEWATAYAKQRGVTRQALIEGALRSFREDCQGGVPDLEDERVPRPLSAEPDWPPKRKPTPPPAVVPPVKRLARSKQSELAMARMRRMNPRRYG